jgi:hypothetical protein
VQNLVNDLFTIFIVFAASNFILSYFLSKLKAQDDKKENLKLVEKVKELIHVVEVETHQGVDYWYDKDNGTFLAQGNTIGEAIEHAKSRYPEHVFILIDRKENITGIICKATNWEPEPHDGNEFRFKL